MNLPEIKTKWMRRGSGEAVTVRQVVNDVHGWRVSAFHEWNEWGTRQVSEWPLDVWNLVMVPLDNTEEAGA